MLKNVKNQQGFSFVEVVISLFLISVALALYAASSKAVVLNRQTSHRDIANHIASATMETLRNSGYSGLPASGQITNSLLSQLPSGSGSYTVSDYNDKTKKVAVTVIWREPGSSATNTVILTTLVTQNGL